MNMIDVEEARRQEIKTDLTHNIFVEAGAGAGKTSILVSRIMNQLKSGLLKIAIKEKYNMRRTPLIGMPNRRKRPKTEELLERLQGVCDITWLEITRVDDHWQETIEVPYEELEDDETGEFIALTICSSAKIDSHGKLLIFMGEKSEYRPE